MKVENGQQQKWQFWIDRGGTFTDIVALSPQGELLTHKLLSDNPEHYADAAVAGIRYFLNLAADELIPAERVKVVKMGTTVATNTLLERKGSPTALLTSQGFKDALSIAYQNRPRLFDRHIQKPAMLYHSVLEAEERVNAEGEVLTALDEAKLKQQLQTLFQQGINSLAIVFMHAYRFPQHEQRAAAIAADIGFQQISCSHQVSPMIKLVGRGDTTVVDAYLSPVLQCYVEQVSSQMPGVPLYFMQSSGALTGAEQFQGKDAILSGPAGGIVGMVRSGQQVGLDRLIGFDMGGTSTDVSHFAGEFEREFETQVAGIRMRTPMLSIHTVAAGGGSILRFDGARFRVGPESAGANPGPASYRRGGPLAITDANVLLGKLQADFFPKVFGPNADQALDEDSVRQQFTHIAEQTRLTVEQVAEGFIQIAVEQMANAIKKISVSRGYDVSDYTLQCFGGAGAQHACLVAQALGIKKIFIHPLAGVLSAYGMGLADQGIVKERSLNLSLNTDQMELVSSQLAELKQQAATELDSLFSQEGERVCHAYVHLRYQGSDSSLQVDFASLSEMETQFKQLYQQRFSFLQDKALVVDAISVEVLNQLPPTAGKIDLASPAERTRQDTQFYSQGQWHQAKLYARESLTAEQHVFGPTIIIEKTATTIIEPDWSATVDGQGNLILDHLTASQTKQISTEQVDPVMLEVFNNQFMNIAELMGLQLQNTAASVNIKERLDFSCAIFDQHGNLVANAPHMPVHLGSMGESILSVIDQFTDSMQAGDVYVLNDPYAGGTHLPDITVITPVYISGADKPDFYVGSRGHHADIGGISPGSIPAFSQHIDEEGIRISGFKLVEKGVFNEAGLRQLLEQNDFPARNPEQNIADLRAQVAANEKGLTELKRLCKEYSLGVVSAYMEFVQDNAEQAVRQVIHELEDGEFTVEMDNGCQIHVQLNMDADQQTVNINFTGSSEQGQHNFNAPKAVTIAAVLFVFRSLVDDDIPLNAGCLRPLHIQVPEGSMLNPVYPAAVVAGNVETSTCVANALYGALGIQASAQPTMNNLTFGNEQYQYYETLAGGSGAGQGYNGADVVQTLMTNSRLTDPEVLESRFPVRVVSHQTKPESGGQGRWQGGNGAIRRLAFEQDMTVTVLANGRQHAAFGLAGGHDGALGQNLLFRKDGTLENLAACAEVTVKAGDEIEIHTPGGGGYGLG